MNKGKSNLIAVTAAVISVFVWIWIFYGDILNHPNAHMLSSTGDGIKSYFVFVDHIKNDTSYSQQRNMNYPYGQTHIFTDGQTIVANVLKAFTNGSDFFEQKSIGIFNLLILLSYPACALFLALILLRFRLPEWFAALAAFCITILSPQVFRMGGHLTLSYVVFFPMSWWLFLKFFEERKTIFAFLGALNSLCWFFVHPYYLMINVLFICCFFLLWIIIDKPNIVSHWVQYLGMILQIIVPVALSRLYLMIVDHHTGRPILPWGFWESYSNISTVFAPIYPPFDGIFKLFFSMTHRYWEGWSYIGLPAVCILLFSIFKLIHELWRRNFLKAIKSVLPFSLSISVLASVLVLFYAMAYPYRWNMEFLFDWLPFLRQFRAVGRFSWVFYYIISVYSFYAIYLGYQYLRKKGVRLAGIVCIIIVAIVYSAEAWYQHKDVSRSVNQAPNFFNKQLLSEDYLEAILFVDSVKHNYQAVLPLPYYHVGTDNFGTGLPDQSMLNSMLIAYQCNTPLMASSAARTPIEEARKLMQFFSPPYLSKEVQNDLPDKKPFLVLVTPGNLTTQEEWVLSKSEKIFENKTMAFYHLNYPDVFTSTADREFAMFEERKDSLLKKEKFLLSEEGWFVYHDFDSLWCDTALHGSGALKGIKKNYTIVIQKQELHLNPELEYMLSFWYYNKGEERNQISCIIAEQEPGSDNENWTYAFSPIHSMVIDGDWSFVEGKFKVKNTGSKLSVFFKGDERSDQLFYADDFMIRPADVDLYKLMVSNDHDRDTILFKNNFWIKRDKMIIR